MNVVGKSTPFQRITEPLTKFDPITPSVSDEVPAMIELGESTVMTGTGLLSVIVVPVKILWSSKFPISSEISNCTGELAKPIGVIVPNALLAILKVTRRICLVPALNF